MPKQWFYVQGGQKYGPFPSAELKRLATSGTLHFSDMVWCDGMSEWRVASTIQGLFSAHEPTAVKPPSPIHAPPANVPPPLPPAPACPWPKLAHHNRHVPTLRLPFLLCYPWPNRKSRWGHRLSLLACRRTRPFSSLEGH